MNREEAIDIFHKITYPNTCNLDNSSRFYLRDREWVIKSIDSLWALGILKFDKVELVKSPRPVKWAYLKRDFDDIAEDIKKAHNPDAMKEAVKNIKYVIEELQCHLS